MRRNSIVNITKFLAAFSIMLYHMNTLGFGSVSVEMDPRCFIDWFLIVTGYYAAKRYIEIDKSINVYKISYYDTINKFLPLMPYIIIATTLQYVVFIAKQFMQHAFSVGDIVILALSKYIPETLLLTSLKGEMPFVEPLWYLSTLLVVFPLFVIFVSHNRYIVAIVSFIYSGVFFGMIRNMVPQNIYRFLYIAAGLCVGAGIYVVSHEFEDLFKRVNPALLSVISIVSILFCFLSSYCTLGIDNENLMCLCVFSIIELSGLSTLSQNSIRLFDYLGRLSVPIYVLHFSVGSVIEMMFNNWSPLTKLVVFVSVTLVLSVAIIELHGRFWKVRLSAKEK